MTTISKNARVDFRLAAEQKTVLERAAALSGLNLSDFVLASSVAAAAEVLQREQRITLSERDWQQFVAALEADTEPTEAARRAAARYNQGRAERGRYHFDHPAADARP